MQNPLSRDPRLALFPAPVGSTGWRLWEMLREAGERAGETLLRHDYIDTFQRHNLIDGDRWHPQVARTRAGALIDSLDTEDSYLPAVRTVVLVGAETVRATRLPRRDWCEWDEFWWLPSLRLRYCTIPHASGRNLLYNDAAMRQRVGDLLLGLRNEWLAARPA